MGKQIYGSNSTTVERKRWDQEPGSSKQEFRAQHGKYLITWIGLKFGSILVDAEHRSSVGKQQIDSEGRRSVIRGTAILFGHFREQDPYEKYQMLYNKDPFFKVCVDTSLERKIDAETAGELGRDLYDQASKYVHETPKPEKDRVLVDARLYPKDQLQFLIAICKLLAVKIDVMHK